MSTEASTEKPVGGVPEFKIIGRLDGVPAIHDSVSYADSLLKSYGLTNYLYSTALGVAGKSYNLASPVLARTKPLIESADGLAVATFDRAEATFPYPFKTPTQDLIVVKQSKAVYDARILPLIQNAQPMLNEVLNKTAQINSALGARAVATVQTSKEYSEHLIEQLKAIAKQGNGLPAQLVEGLQKATTDIKEIVYQKDATLQEKSNKVGAYVVDQVKPVVDQIYEYILGAKRAAEEKAEAEKDKVHGAPQ